MPVVILAGCAGPMTVERGIGILNKEYDVNLNRGPDREKLDEVREYFLSNPSRAKTSLLPLCAGDNRNIQRFSMETCAEAMPDDPDVTDAAKKLLSEKSSKTRLVAAEALAARGIPEAEAELVKFLKDERASRRARAAMALSCGKFAGSAKAIAELLNDRDTVTIHMPVKKHFLWIFRWESRDFRSFPVREVALYSLSRLADDDFGRPAGGEIEALNAACDRAAEWAGSQPQ
jgi:hypothetical protein